jgi:hypothetical protein
MERRDALIIAIAGILAIVAGLTLASLLGIEIGFLQGGIYPPGIIGPTGIYPP